MREQVESGTWAFEAAARGGLTPQLRFLSSTFRFAGSTIMDHFCFLFAFVPNNLL